MMKAWFSSTGRRGLSLVFGLMCLIALASQPALAARRPNPADPALLFHEANQLYQKGAYPEAIAVYRQVLAEGLESGNLYYNLGNAYFKTGHKGWAVLYYEKARRLMPGDSELRANLGYVLAGVAADRPGGWRDLLDRLTHLAPLDWLLVFSSGCLFLLCGLAVAAILVPQQFSAKTGRCHACWLAATLIIGLCFLGGAVISGLTLNDQRHAWAVAVADGEARFEPKSDGTIYYHLPEGAKLQMLDKKDGWVLVKRSDGRQGWVQRPDLAQI